MSSSLGYQNDPEKTIIAKSLNTTLENSNIFESDNKDGIEFLTVIHICLILIVITHLIYFIYMLIKQNLYRNSLIRTQPDKPDNLRKINDSCSICLEDLKFEVQMLCSHSYCAQCIISYGKQRYNFCDIQCPICRADSKFIFQQFERTEENKEQYDLILDYNHETTRHYPTSFCFCLDMFRLAQYYHTQLTNFNNSRFEQHRKIFIIIFIIVFLVVIFPLTWKFSNYLELLEDVFFYVMLIISCSEYFYRRFRNQTNSEFDRIHSSADVSQNEIRV